MASPDDIRRQMEAMRAALRRDASGAAADARELMDWRHHFRRHPWLCCAAAGAVGYLIVPRRGPKLPFDVSALSQAAANLSAAAEGKSVSAPSQAASMQAALRAAVGMATASLVRKSASYLLERGWKHFAGPRGEHATAHNGAYSETNT